MEGKRDAEEALDGLCEGRYYWKGVDDSMTTFLPEKKTINCADLQGNRAKKYNIWELKKQQEIYFDCIPFKK